jgi:hypothetical protein
VQCRAELVRITRKFWSQKGSKNGALASKNSKTYRLYSPG